MRLRILYIIFAVSVCVCLSCSEDDPCNSGDVEVSGLEDHGCTNTAHRLNVISSKEFELIRSQEEYDALIQGDCEPNLDWMQYDLIAGMVGLPNGVQSINKSLVRDCPNNRLNLTITIQLNETAVAPRISFDAVIPKLRNNEDIFVEVVSLP